MTRAQMQALLLEHRMIAVLRLDSADAALAVARAVIAGGARLVEVTLTVPGAHRVIRELAREAPPEVIIGAGTVLSVPDLNAAFAAGARFAISPDVNPKVIRSAADRGIFHVPGAMTPTEIANAQRAGASVVKIFPIASLGGAAHIRALRGPFPATPFLVTGGVDLPAVDEFFAAGTSAIGLTTTLIAPAAVAAGDWARITLRTREWRQRLDTGAGSVP